MKLMDLLGRKIKKLMKLNYLINMKILTRERKKLNHQKNVRSKIK